MMLKNVRPTSEDEYIIEPPLLYDLEYIHAEAGARAAEPATSYEVHAAEQQPPHTAAADAETLDFHNYEPTCTAVRDVAIIAALIAIIAAYVKSSLHTPRL